MSISLLDRFHWKGDKMTDGYNVTYSAGEISEVTIDTLVGIGATLFSFVSLIALVMLYGWLKKRV